MFTGLYCLVLYLSFFFDVVLFFDTYLNSSVHKVLSIDNKKIVGVGGLVRLSYDLDDVFVDDEEFDELL
jgi:hypothetical protein